jgi:hypothetical protein
MSSELRRYATLDVTHLSKDQTTNLIKNLLRTSARFNLCKTVQVAGFNTEGRRYLTVSGESHAMFSGSTKSSMRKLMEPTTRGMPVVYVEAHIRPPLEGEPHQTVNLGRYGSTGCPAEGIPMHPDAQRLRELGKIT